MVPAEKYAVAIPRRIGTSSSTVVATAGSAGATRLSRHPPIIGKSNRVFGAISCRCSPPTLRNLGARSPENRSAVTKLSRNSVRGLNVSFSCSYPPCQLLDGTPFRTVNPRCARFGEWYAVSGEVRRVPLELALPRRTIRANTSYVGVSQIGRAHSTRAASPSRYID